MDKPFDDPITVIENFMFEMAIVTYQNLNTWWTKVTIAALLCVFIVIQRLIAIRAEKLKAS